jgi:hypothetical protein
VQAALEKPYLPWMRETVVLAVMVFPLMFMRRRRVMVVVMVGVLAATNGCGAGRAIPVSGGPTVTYPTPAGSYPITVTGTTAGVSHSVVLTLVVQ